MKLGVRSKTAELSEEGARGQNAKIAAFYAPVRDRKLFDLIGFYSADIEILSRLGYRVVTCTSIGEVFESRPSIIFAWWWHRSSGLALRARLMGIPMIVTGATDFRFPEQNHWRRYLRIALTSITGRLAGCNLAISQFELRDLELVRARERRVVSCCVDVDRLRPTVNDGSDSQSAVIVAQMNPRSISRKGVDTAILAAAIVRESLPDFRLVLAGPEDDAGRVLLDELTQGLPEGLVTRHGRVTFERKVELLQSAAIYLQPSVYEGFGLSLLEAMSCGCYPIASCAGALPEVVGESGEMVERDPAQIAAAVLRFLAMGPGSRSMLRRQARERAESFSFDRRFEAIAQEIRVLIGA